MSQDIPHALAAIEQMNATVQMALALHEGGREVDLRGLETDTATLCTAVSLLPRPAARVLRPALEVLARDVERLNAAMASA